MTRTLQPLQRCARIFRYSLISLPYLSYVSFPGFLYVMGMLYRQYAFRALDRLTRNGLILISLLMLISALGAYDREQALLQLFNFLPFFALFAVLPLILQTITLLEQLALGLVLTSLPLSLYGFVQFLLKLAVRNRWVSREFRQSPLGEWVRSLPHQNRAGSIFAHPNVFASYLVVILGLGLGLGLYRRLIWAAVDSEPRSASRLQNWLYTGLPIALVFVLVGLYTTGSRNGIWIAAVQCGVFSGIVLLQRSDRRLGYASLVGLGVLMAAIVAGGLAGRIVSVEGLMRDPRVDVWAIAWDLFRQRPWLGWGLGSYPQLYPALTSNPQFDYISHTHNLWLLLTTETGIGVTVLLTGVIGRIYGWGVIRFIRDLQWPKPQMTPTLAILLGYLLAFGGAIAFALFDVTFYDARINFINWAVLAGIYAMTPLFPMAFSDDSSGPGAEETTQEQVERDWGSEESP